MKRNNQIPDELEIIKDLEKFNIPSPIPTAKEIINYLQTPSAISYQKILEQLQKHKPLEYILGYTYFYNYKFFVSQDVLIPRIETEFIVKTVIKQAKHLKQATIIDIGTGSGAILISIAKILGQTNQYIGIDISQKAIDIAQQNALYHKVQAQFLTGDFNKLKSLSLTQPLIIVANLPYIPTNEMLNLPQSVINFEPKLALDGGKAGLELYQRLWKIIKDLDYSPALEIYEAHQPTLSKALKLYQAIMPNRNAKIIKDCFDRNRFILVQD